MSPEVAHRVIALSRGIALLAQIADIGQSQSRAVHAHTRHWPRSRPQQIDAASSLPNYLFGKLVRM